MSGLFVVFEGPDGCGKTTMVEKAVNYLRSKNFTVVQTKDPGGTAWGTGIRELMFGDLKLQDLTPGGVDLLFLTSHMQNWKTRVEPALIRGDFVVSDRWFESAIAYMSQREVSPGIRSVYRSEHGNEPDVLILLYGDPVKLTARARARTDQPNQAKKPWNDPEVLLKVQNEYFAECRHEEGFSPICVDDKSIDQVWEEVQDVLELAIARRRHKTRKEAVQENINKYALA